MTAMARQVSWLVALVLVAGGCRARAASPWGAWLKELFGPPASP
jgi:hypothetical protein